MSDVESNIRIDIDTADALANIQALQRQISTFYSQMTRGGAAATAQAVQMQQKLVNTINRTGQFSATLQRTTSTTEAFTTALERNKLSMGEYFRFAAGATRTFGRSFASEFATIDKVARERVKTLQTQYIKLGRDATGAMSSIAVRPLALDMEDYGTKTMIAAQKQQIFNQLVTQGSTNLLNFGKNTQWAGRQLMVGFTIPLAMMGSVAVREFMAMEEQTLRFQRVYGDFSTTVQETEAMTNSIKELSVEFTKYGLAVEESMGLAADAAAMGLKGVDLEAQVREASRLAVLGGVEQKAGLETTISLTSAFGTATEDLTDKINFLNAVENQTITSIEDLTIAIPKAGPVIQQLGGDVEDLTFFLTAMREGGINASEGANALKSGLASIINPTEKASQFLEGFGINLKGIVDSNKGDVKGIVIDFAQALDTLDPLNRAQAIEQLFGKFQFARLSTLFQNVIAEGSQANRVLELTQSTTQELGILADRELGKIEDSASYRFQGALERIQAQLAPIGEEFLKVITPIIDFGADLLENFNNMGEGAKQFVVGLIAVVGGLAPVFIMTFGLVANAIANAIKFFQFLGNVFNKVSGNSEILGMSTDYMTQQQLEAAAVAASLGQTHNSLTQIFTSEAGAIDRLTAAYTRAVAAQRSFTGPIMAAGPTRVAGYNNGVVVVPGSGNKDTMPAMLTPGEAVIPKDMAKKYRPLIAAMISDNIPGFADGKMPLGSPLLNTYGNATIYLPQTWNTKMGSTSGMGIPSADIASYIRSSGSAGMAPLMAVIASSIGESLNSKELAGTWRKVGTKFSNVAAAALESSGQAFVKDADLERILVPAFRDAAKGVTVAGKEIDVALEKAINEIRTVSRVGRQSGTVGGEIGRINLGGSYTGVGGTAKKYAMRENPEMFQDVVSNNKRRLFTRISADRMEPAEMAHITKSGIMNVDSLIARITPYMKDKMNEVTAKITKLFADTTASGMARAGKTASPSKKMIEIGRDHSLGAQQGFADGQDEMRRAGSRLAQAGADGMTQAVRRTTKTMVAELMQTGNSQIKAVQDKLGRMQYFDAATGRRISAGAAQETFTQMSAQQLREERNARRNERRALQNTSSQSMYGMSRDTFRGRTAEERAILRRQARDRQRQAQEQARIAREQARAQAAAAAEQLRIDEANRRRQEERAARRQQTMANMRARLPGATMGVGMIASSAMMGMSMMGGPAGEIANQMMGPVMAISGVASALSLIPGPAALVVGGLAALGVGIFALDQHIRGINEAASKTAQSLSSGEQSMRRFSEMSGRVSPVDVVRQMRFDEAAGRQADISNESFGAQYLETEEGQAFISEIRNGIESQSKSAVVGQLATQMATAISAGLLTTTEAQSVIDNLANELNDASLSTRVTAELIDIVGPNGENVLENPLELSVRLVEISGDQLTGALANVDFGSMAPGWFFGATDKDMEQRAFAEAQVAQGFQDVIDQERLALANAELRNKLKIEELRIAGDIAGIAEQQAKFEEEKVAIQGASANQLRQAIALLEQGQRQETVSITDQYGNVINRVNQFTLDQSSAAILDKIQQSTNELFAEQEGAIKDRASSVIESIADSSRLSAGTRATLLASIEVENFEVFNKLESLFNPDNVENRQVYDFVARVSTELGSEAGVAAADVVGMFGDPNDRDKLVNFIANFDIENPENISSLLDARQLIEGIGQDFNLDNFVDETGNATSSLKRLSAQYAEIEAKAAAGPIVLEQLTFIDEEAFAQMQINQQWFDSLDPVQQKIFLQRYVTVFENATDQQATQWYKDNMGVSARAMEGKNIEEIRAAYAANSAREFATSLGGLVGGGGTGSGPSGGGAAGGGGGGSAQKESSALDGIVQRLKEVQKGSLKLTEGWAASMAALKGLGSAGFNAFNGISQQLIKLGASEDLISLITGMSPEEYEKRKNELFNFNASGQITSLKANAQVIQDALRAATLGEFQASQKQLSANVIDQTAAVRKLVAAGYSLAEAYAMAGDANLADAIANNNSSKTLQELIRTTREAEKATKDFAAAQSLAEESQNFADRGKLVSFLTQNAGQFTDAQMSAILQNEDLARLVLDPTIDPAVLQQALADAEAAANLEIRIDMLTLEGQESLFSDALSNAFDAFSAQEKMIELEFDAKTSPFEDIVNAGRDAISDIRNAPGGLDDLEADLSVIAEQEKDITDEYNKKFEALDKISEINDRIARQQKSQLNIANALASGDVAAAAAAAQEMRAQNVNDALMDQRRLLEAARDAEIEGLTNAEGLTRDQIEQKIRDLKKEILRTEEDMIEPAQYQIDLLDRQKQKIIDSIEVLGKTREEWEKIQAEADLARVNTETYNTAIDNGLLALEEMKKTWAEIATSVVSVTGGLNSLSTRTPSFIGNLTPPIAEVPAEAYGLSATASVNRQAEKINNMYTYTINVDASGSANADEVANKVIRKIRSIEDQRIRGNRLNG